VMFNAGLAVAVAALGAFAVAIGARLLVLQWRMGREGPPRLPPPRARLREALQGNGRPRGDRTPANTGASGGELVCPATVTGGTSRQHPTGTARTIARIGGGVCTKLYAGVIRGRMGGA
jgi:hypothetical protein